jgi:mannose-1-phosphate guanylyltransferase
MPNSHYYGLILAGGRGTRFWPLSRRSRAKQVLALFGKRTLIQQTVDRLRPQVPPERIWILTNEHLRAEIMRQLPEVPRRQILAEPAQRNTAPAIGLAAHILNSIDPRAVMGVFPADHVIGRRRDYLRTIRLAWRAAEAGRMVVLGIKPRWAETGYGYIEFAPGSGEGEVHQVRRFREKPDEKTAREFVAAGNFYWNAGMFFWRASVLLDALRTHLPKTATLLASLPSFKSRQFPMRMKRVFPRAENVSIDYAVMEKAAEVYGIPCAEIGWNDVGSWNAVYELLTRDSQANAGVSAFLAHESQGNYIDARGKTVALVGVRDLVIVDTPDALLVADRRNSQKVGDIVKHLEQLKRDDLL